ncbi:hypothetical protein FM106_09390 [Brachybacterium faecium]|nr:hypothetical protein FM106_09390 [Brachybacterium faecium]
MPKASTSFLIISLIARIFIIRNIYQKRKVRSLFLNESL